MSEEYLLTTSISGNGSINPSDVNGIKDCNSYVKLIAIADPGWKFYGWNIGGITFESDTFLLLRMVQDLSVEALFIKEYYNLNCTSSIGGKVIGTMNKIPYGEYIELEAIPDDGWEFEEWVGDLSGDTNPGEVYVTGNVNFGAKFTQL